MEVPIHELNEQLQCPICHGYLIDATTLGECLHSFCRSCIVQYLQFWEGDISIELKKDLCTKATMPAYPECPVCQRALHESKPTSQLRSDSVLQALVYKLVPNLYNQEMQKRKTFYQNFSNEFDAQLSPEKRGEGRRCLYRTVPSVTLHHENDVDTITFQRGVVTAQNHHLNHLDIRRYHPQPAVSLILHYFDCDRALESERELANNLSNEVENGLPYKRAKLESPTKENTEPGDSVENRNTKFQKIYLLVQPLATLSLFRQLLLHKYTLLNGAYEPVFFFPKADYTLSLDCTIQNLMDMSAYRKSAPMCLFFAIVPRSQLSARSLVERRELYLRQKLLEKVKEGSEKPSEDESDPFSATCDSEANDSTNESFPRFKKRQPIRNCRNRLSKSNAQAMHFNKTSGVEEFASNTNVLSHRLRNRPSKSDCQRTSQ